MSLIVYEVASSAWASAPSDEDGDAFTAESDLAPATYDLMGDELLRCEAAYDEEEDPMLRAVDVLREHGWGVAEDWEPDEMGYLAAAVPVEAW
ncbi:hypothetical protein [Streptomyces sp. NPDC007088]|uniref:hypothetical protein n=1 Tax=Streptomyces sp. NPDC007088 TaxID=3364773 RepID=UPI003673FCF3